MTKQDASSSLLPCHAHSAETNTSPATAPRSGRGLSRLTLAWPEYLIHSGPRDPLCPAGEQVWGQVADEHDLGTVVGKGTTAICPLLRYPQGPSRPSNEAQTPGSDSQDLPPPAPNSAGPPRAPHTPLAVSLCLSSLQQVSRLAKVTGTLIRQAENLTAPHPHPITVPQSRDSLPAPGSVNNSETMKPAKLDHLHLCVSKLFPLHKAPSYQKSS